MKPPILRICEADKYRLARLKGLTGVAHNNVLCRWAFSLSLGNEGRPAHAPSDTAVEIEWDTFGGQFAPIYLALLTEWCHRHGRPLTQESLAAELREHIHRGIGHLLDRVKSAVDLVSLALGTRPGEAG